MEGVEMHLCGGSKKANDHFLYIGIYIYIVHCTPLSHFWHYTGLLSTSNIQGFGCSLLLRLGQG